MAQKKITDLPTLAAADSGDYYVIVDTSASTTKKVAAENVLPSGSVATAKIADDAVTPAKLKSGTGSSWSWQSWTPTFTNFTLGTGTINSAKYTQVGKTVYFRLRITLGSTPGIGTDVQFTLPVASASEENSGTAPFNLIGQGILYDAGTANYIGYIGTSSTTTAWILRSVGGTQIAGLTSTQPFTWASGDVIYLRGSYEAA